MPTEKDARALKRQKEKAEKLHPKPILLSSGNWRCQIMIDGERLSVVDSDPEVAHAKALALKAGIAEEIRLREEQKSGNITLGDAIDQYISARENVLSPSTIAGYKEIKRNRFKGLMGKKVSKIDAQDLQIAVNQEAKTVAAKTIKNALGLVTSVIAEYREINTDRLRLPQRKRTEHAYLDEAGMISLFEAIQGDIVELPILMAVWLGMRRSEILGLCWDCVDFDRNQIRLERTLVKGPDGYALRQEMKTEASRRILECPGYIMQKLDDYSHQKVGRVFKMHPNTIYKNMKKVCEKNGIDFVGVHGLRHTNASVMLSLGIVDKIAMARGGWSTDFTMKQIYQHVFDADKVTAGEKVDKFFQSIAAGKDPRKEDSEDTNDTTRGKPESTE